MSADVRLPDVVPLLSRGRHRTPRKGACFMEMASYLAGERWSDHPACTHPLLAALARDVNDHTSDAARPRLGLLIPSVVGLVADDPTVDVRLALLCATHALPVAAEERQRVMAVAALTCERVLAQAEGRPAELAASTTAALASAPHAAAWAQRFVGDLQPSVRGFRRYSAPHVVRCAVRGIAQACVPDPDRRLHDLLAEAVDGVRSWAAVEKAPTPTSPDRWQEACRLTGAGVREDART